MDTEKYIKNSEKEVKGPHKEWIDDLLARMSRGGSVFEIGSATSRDADYIENINSLITVTRSDKNLMFVNYMNNKTKNAHVFDILEDDFNDEEKYTSFFAHNIINHFTLDDVKKALSKMKSHLLKGGYIAFSFPLGDNTTLLKWNSNPENIFCRYHSIDEIVKIINSLNMNFLYLKETQDGKMCFLTIS